MYRPQKARGTPNVREMEWTFKPDMEMNSAQKLAEMGCGSAIVNSAIDRSRIFVSVSNAKTFLKYYKYACKSGIDSREDAIQGFLPYYNALLSEEYLVKIYHELWAEKFYKIKHEAEKFINQ